MCMYIYIEFQLMTRILDVHGEYWCGGSTGRGGFVSVTRYVYNMQIYVQLMYSGR